jgi:hypothetical protein
MLAGKWPEHGCEYCRNIEQAGGQSDRITNLDFPGIHAPPELDHDHVAVDVTPRILEVYFDNTCNLKCLYCGPHFSSLWDAENIRHGAGAFAKSANIESNKQKIFSWLKQHGHNRFDVMNALKPLITNDIAEIHPKGRAPYMAPNTANYLLLSNYMDGAPVTDGDRRYMFLHSAIELDAARSMSSGGYFNRLFGALQAHPGAIRRWLLGYSLHPEFVVDGRAPDTQVRSIVLEAVKPELDSLVEDVIEDDFFGDTLVFSELVTALKLAGATLVSEKNVGASLGRLGYGFMGRQRRGGARCRVWSRKKLSTQEISEFLSHQKGSVPLVAL